MSVEPSTTPNDYGKSDAGFKQLRTSLEPDSLDLGIAETPIDRFFVCSGSPAPDIDEATWRITIDGDGVERPVEVSVAELRELPQHTVHSWLECAGNGRGMYALAGGYDEARELADTGWTLGAMGIATWSGPRLRDVLALAGPKQAAAWISPEGDDDDNTEGEAARMCMPRDKAEHDDTLVALTMNGAPLVQAHGAPVRVLVPGWVGAYSVKWVRRIEVSTSWVPSWRADVYYVRRPHTPSRAASRSRGLRSCLLDARACVGTPAAVRALCSALSGVSMMGSGTKRPSIRFRGGGPGTRSRARSTSALASTTCAPALGMPTATRNPCTKSSTRTRSCGTPSPATQSPHSPPRQSAGPARARHHWAAEATRRPGALRASGSAIVS